MVGGSWDFVTTSNWACKRLLIGVAYIRPVGEIVSRVVRPATEETTSKVLGILGSIV